MTFVLFLFFDFVISLLLAFCRVVKTERNDFCYDFPECESLALCETENKI